MSLACSLYARTIDHNWSELVAEGVARSTVPTSVKYEYVMKVKPLAWKPNSVWMRTILKYTEKCKLDWSTQFHPSQSIAHTRTPNANTKSSAGSSNAVVITSHCRHTNKPIRCTRGQNRKYKVWHLPKPTNTTAKNESISRAARNRRRRRILRTINLPHSRRLTLSIRYAALRYDANLMTFPPPNDDGPNDRNEA